MYFVEINCKPQYGKSSYFCQKNHNKKNKIAINHFRLRQNIISQFKFQILNWHGCEVQILSIRFLNGLDHIVSTCSNLGRKFGIITLVIPTFWANSQFGVLVF